MMILRKCNGAVGALAIMLGTGLIVTLDVVRGQAAAPAVPGTALREKA